MEKRVLDILRRVFNDANLDETCSQKTCKAWDSMNHLNLVVELEMEFDISFEPEEIAAMASFEDVIRIIKNKI